MNNDVLWKQNIVTPENLTTTGEFELDGKVEMETLGEESGDHLWHHMYS